MQRKREIVTGIDIGTYTVRVVIAEWGKDMTMPRIIGTGMSESRGLRHGYIVNIGDTAKSIQTAVAKAEKASGVKVRRAFISAGGIGLDGISATGTAMITRADGEVTDLDIKKAIDSCETESRELQNKRIIHAIPISYRLDGNEVLGKPQRMKGMKLEAKLLLITALSQHINDTILAVEEAGIEVEDVFASPLAAGYVTITRQQKTAGCVLANIGAETVSIVVFENNIPVSLKVFPIGSTDITNDLALGLKVSLDEAESIKLGKTADSRFPKKKVDDIVSARLSDIFDLIDAHLTQIGRNQLLPAGVIITGGGSGISAVSDMAKAALHLPSRIGYPSFGSADPRSGDSQFKGEMVNIPAWTVAYGLCILGFSSDKESSGGVPSVKNIKNFLLDFFKQFLP
ncbi:MAG: cell division protein FtsA [Candidatus Paceibacterota bacterium]|jgi:cell division protein FtsA|nr:cell division protein FtsA [Candidatus Paceibacterota bacterium]